MKIKCETEQELKQKKFKIVLNIIVNMEKLLNDFVNYLKNTPKEQREKDFKEIYEKYNYGPSVEEYFGNGGINKNKYCIQDESTDGILLYCDSISDALDYVISLEKSNKIGCYIIFNYISEKEIYRTNNTSCKF